MKGTEIARRRELLGITQDELAIMAGVSVQSVGRIERGIRVRADTAKAVFGALDLPYAPLNGIEVIAPDALREDPSTDQMVEALGRMPGMRYLVRLDGEAWTQAFRSQGLRQQVAVLGLSLWWTTFVVSTVTLAFGLAALTLGFRVLGANPLVSMAVEANIPAAVAALASAVVIGSRFHELRQQAMTDPAYGIAMSDDAVLSLKLRNGRLAVERVSTASGTSRSRTTYGAFATYQIADGIAVTRVHGLPDHPGLDTMLRRSRRCDPFQEIPIETAHAA